MGDQMNIQFSRTIEVKKEVDVFIAGGGPSGVVAAVAAARAGAKVFLAEREQCFGGMGTIAQVPAFMRFSDGVNFLAGGVGREIFERLYGEEADYTEKEYSIDLEKLKLIYDEMMLESGADFTFSTDLIAAEVENGEIKYVVVKGKEEIFAVKAKVYIDTTGDGILAAWAGAPFEKGDDEGAMMPGTLCTIWHNIDWDRAIVEIGKDPDNRFLHKAFEEGMFTVKDPSLPGMWKFERDLGGGNIGHVFGVDGTDEKSITNGIIDARKRMHEYQTYYNKYLDGYENAKIVTSAPVLGIRESRRIMGEKVLTSDAYFEHSDFEDEIGRYNYPIDLHSSSPGKKAKNEKFIGIYAKDYEKGKSYGIPFGTLLPKNTKNVLVAGRAISADREIMGSIRVMPCCYITGMAAGTAAALAAIQDVAVREIDIKKLQFTLKEMGAFLPNC